MESSDLQLLRRLLTEEKILTLAVVVDGVPVAGVLPFRAEPGLSSLLVHTSALARHSRGLVPGAPFSAAIHLPLAPGVDPLHTRRSRRDDRPHHPRCRPPEIVTHARGRSPGSQ